jgi:hypothetical protein
MFRKHFFYPKQSEVAIEQLLFRPGVMPASTKLVPPALAGASMPIVFQVENERRR